MKYLGRRAIRAVLLLFGVSVLCFVFTEMAPGSFFDEMRLNPQISPETIASLRSRYGLDQPLAVRYGYWVRAALQADFGYSIAYNTPVAPLLWTRAKNTLLLNTVAMLLTWVISVPVGVWVATRRGSAWDRAIDGVNSILISTPEIVIAVALLAIVVRWRVLPVGGMTSVDHDALSGWGRVRETATRMLLPTIMLTLAESGIIVRHVRASVIEVLGAPFVQAGRGLGIGSIRLLYRHVLPVAANPVISLFGLSLAGLMSGSLLIEAICGWPGLGPLILDATLSRDFCVVIGGIILSTVFMLGGTLIADAMLLACDPRIRTGSTHEA